MTSTTTLAVQHRQQFDLSPQTFEQALTFSNYLADSDMVPKDFKGKPGNCLIAMQWGAELGLKPLQAMQNLAIINGRPSLWGDAVIALVRGSALCEFVIETDDGNVATCRVKRRGEPEQLRTFSMEDAKKAGLAGKQGPWSQYPQRMRQMRARAFALRDVFPDVLRGMPVAEEVMDTPTERFMGEASLVQPALAQPETYPQADFEANLPKWSKVIAAGKKTAEDVIATVESKAKLTEEQKQQIRAVKAPAAAEPAPATTAAPMAMAYDAVLQRLKAANDLDALDAAADLIGHVEDSAERSDLASLYEERRMAIAG